MTRRAVPPQDSRRGARTAGEAAPRRSSRSRVGEPGPEARRLGRVAHDLRAPLGMIAHAFEEVDEQLGDQATEELRRTSALAYRALARLHRLADRLALVAELEEGLVPQALQITDLVEVVQQAVQVVKSLDSRREVDLSCALGEAPCPVRANRRWLEFAIAELVHNAVRHARRRVAVELECVGPEARIVIEDDGRGFTPLLRDGLRRGPASWSSVGPGLGLVIVDRVMGAHAGRTHVDESRFSGFSPGTRGARLVVSIPAYVS